MDARAWAANNLAARLLSGPWTPEAIGAGVDASLGPSGLWTRKALIASLAALGDTGYPPAPLTVTNHLLGSAGFRPVPGRPVVVVLDPPGFAPAPPFADLRLPALRTLGELNDWLGEPQEQLDWLADERRGHRRALDTSLQHYRYAFIAKQGGQKRLIEAPKPRLKAIQRRVLDEILSLVPVHPCANGFVRGRSCLTGAQVHAGEAVVATFDLADFFPSIGLGRVHGLFRRLGYPWAVARRLAGLCATITPRSVVTRLLEAGRETQALYDVPHLPQGAPTSPALANILAWTLDRRLQGLARSADANYTRYADDLAFSGDATFAAGQVRFRKTVETVVLEEGFSLNAAKTKTMRQNARQRVTGIVVNAHCNVGRAEFDRLKAILHHCIQTGPAGQNREGLPDFRRHLDGRVTWVEQVNLRRGTKLRHLFERIDWGLGGPAVEGMESSA